MRTTKRVGIGAGLALLLGLLMAGSAMAAGSAYIDQIASALRGSHVYVDPAAQPTLNSTQKQALEQKIADSGRPIYLVLVDNTKANAAASSPRKFLGGLNSVMGGSSEHIIGVSTKKGFYANGYNAPDNVQDNAGPKAKQLSEGSSNPYDTYSKWVDAMVTLYQETPAPVADEPQVSTASQSSDSDGFPWGWLLGGVLGVLIGIFAWAMLGGLRKKEDVEQFYTGSPGAYDSSKMPDPFTSNYSGTNVVPDDKVMLDEDGLPHADPNANASNPDDVPATPKVYGVTREYVNRKRQTPRRRKSHKGSKSHNGSGNGTTTVRIDNRRYECSQHPSGTRQTLFDGTTYGGTVIPRGYYDLSFIQWATLVGLMNDNESHHHHAAVPVYNDPEPAATNAGQTDGGQWATDVDDDKSSGKTDGGSWASSTQDDEDDKSTYTPAYSAPSFTSSWSSDDSSSGTTDGGSWASSDSSSDSSSSSSSDSGGW